MEDNMASRPFEGINILDFTWAATGPHSLNPLAFFGATIIKVESRGKFDGLRTLGPFKDGIADPEHSYSFAYSQSGKRYNVTLNLSHPKGMEIIKKLIKWADIVADSYSTGTMEKWGLDYEGVKKIKPDIIMLRTCMHGHTGPLSKQHGQGFVLTALTGFTHQLARPTAIRCLRSVYRLYCAPVEYSRPDCRTRLPPPHRQRAVHRPVPA
jgi:benzylsuccinate CoA-transferase BbsF subunit